MSHHYRNLARSVGGNSMEQNEAHISGTVQSPPAPQRNTGNQSNTNSASGNGEPVEEGYDEVFFPALTRDYECPICMMALREPMQTCECGHRFCKTCIDKHMRTNGKTCPVDNQEIKLIFHDNFAKGKIKQSTVKCRTIKSNKECPWIGPLQEHQAHYDVCGFVDVQCPKGCGQTFERRAQENHIKKECQERTTTCSFCKTNIAKITLKDVGRFGSIVPHAIKKMLWDKFSAHEKECQKVQAACDFRKYGCEWTGLQANLPNHHQAEIANHLSLLAAVMSTLLPSNHDKTRGGSSKLGEATTSTFDDLSRQLAKNSEMLGQLKTSMEQTERKFRDHISRVERQQADNYASFTSIRNNIVELEARMCNGVYLWRITGYARHFENARLGIATAVHSPPFYTSFNGYKMCLRVNPNGVDTGYGSHISLFVHMMQSEWDGILYWPFSGRISLSILDQSDDGDYKHHISETLVTKPNLLAFQRPTTPRNHKGYGYVEFAHLDTLQERQYVKNDCLLVRVQVFSVNSA